MGAEAVELIAEGIDPVVEAVEVIGQFPGGIELVAPGAVGAFDVAVELRGTRRQCVEGDGAALTFVLENRLELAAAVHLDGLDGERHVGDEFVEEASGVSGGGAPARFGAGLPAHRIAGGELLDERPAATGGNGHGVELDYLPGLRRFQALGQTLRVRALTPQCARGLAAQVRRLAHHAAPHQVAQDATDHALADAHALALQHHRQLGLAPHRIVAAQLLDCGDHLQRPTRRTQPPGSPRAGLGMPRPAVQRGARYADELGRLSRAQPVAAGFVPARHMLASAGRDAPLGALQPGRQ